MLLGTSAFGLGCVKTRDRRVFGGPFTVPDIEKTSLQAM
jgi:hypothetical protein